MTNPNDAREAIQRELEKQQIRREIIAAEIARRRLPEGESLWFSKKEAEEREEFRNKEGEKEFSGNFLKKKRKRAREEEKQGAPFGELQQKNSREKE